MTGDRRRREITIHRTCSLPPADIRRRLGIRVTSPARTLIDIAPRLTDTQLTRAFNDLRLSGHLKPDQLAGAPSRLRALLDDQAPTRSAFEDQFRKLADRFGLPRPQINVHVCGHEVDALFSEEKVIVELDGYRYHGNRDSFERDRERDVASLEDGFVTVRITWHRLTADPVREARRLERILWARRK